MMGRGLLCPTISQMTLNLWITRAEDFRLQSGSPAIDRGIDLSSEGITFDYTWHLSVLRALLMTSELMNTCSRSRDIPLPRQDQSRFCSAEFRSQRYRYNSGSFSISCM